ncbi:VOC family protein [Mucilaginibacter sp. 14171R-50]|nr:VOC family protein [Mucilaginibacter sp. 14171R-50]
MVKPMFRMFDYDKAIEFYINWLGFKIDWEHKIDGIPIYIQLSLNDVQFHLSEHHGDASPGSHFRIENFTGLKAYHQQLIDKQYKYNRPGLQVPEWNPNSIEMTVNDPFLNRITFAEVINSKS